MAADDDLAKLSLADRLAIQDVISLHGHVCDSGRLDDFRLVMTGDVIYDVSALGGEPLMGIPAVVAASRALGDRNPLAHHVTNVVITAASGEGVEVSSKAIAIGADGVASSALYEDLVQRTPAGWRIARRRVIPRRRPLHP